MRKLFLDKIDNILTLQGENHNHLSVVLRSKAGDTVTVCNGDGYDYEFKIAAITKTETRLELTDKKQNFSESVINLTLYSAVLKGDKNDTVVRTCTELGVNEFCPIITTNAAAKTESYKTDRLQKIALEAAKQSGRGKVPKVNAPIAFTKMCDELKKFDLVVFAYENFVKDNIKDFLLENFKNKDCKNIAAIVGGEGGFTQDEANALINLNVKPLHLGNRILRADTATATVVAIIMFTAGEMQ